MANFDSEFFGLVFPGLQATQKIHAQNSRPELSAFLSNFTFSNPKFIHADFLLPGETKKGCGQSAESLRKFHRNFRAGFRQNGFFADFYFWAAGFFSRIFSPDFFSSFFWEKCPEKSSGKMPGKILQNLYNKNPPTHFCRLPRPRNLRKIFCNDPFPNDPITQRTQPYWKHYGIVNHCAVVFLLRPPKLLRCEPFFESRDACNFQGKRCPRKEVAIVNHCVIVNLLCIVNLLWHSDLKYGGVLWEVWCWLRASSVSQPQLSWLCSTSLAFERRVQANILIWSADVCGFAQGEFFM